MYQIHTKMLDEEIMPGLREKVRQSGSVEDFLRKSIAAHNMLDERDIDPRVLHDLVTKEIKDIPLFIIELYLMRNVPNGSDVQRGRATTEALHEVSACAEALLGFSGKDTLHYGYFAPAYEKALRAQRASYEKKGRDIMDEEHPYKALLIGALSPLTSSAFESSVSNIFPNAVIATVDLQGAATRKEDGFILASGMQLPFADETFDSVHTNILLHQLVSNNPEENSQTIYDKLQKLIPELFRVLKPGGKLILVEGNLRRTFKKDNYDDAVACLEVEICEILGLKAEQFTAERALCFPNKKDIFEYYANGMDSSEYPVKRSEGSVLITVTK